MLFVAWRLLPVLRDRLKSSDVNVQRRENGIYRAKAGAELTSALRDAGIPVPVVVYCSVGSVAKFSKEAIQAGAVAATASPIELLQRLDSTVRMENGD